MAKFMLLIRGSVMEWSSYSPEKIQREMKRYMDWSEKLRQESRMVDGSELGALAAVVRKDNLTTVTKDGPFTETKEGVGGYYVIEAADAADAAEVSTGCPALDHGYAIEIYPMGE